MQEKVLYVWLLQQKLLPLPRIIKKTEVRMKRIAQILAGFLVVVVVALVGAIALLNTSYVQDKLVGRAITYLSEKLQTRVSLERLTFDLFRQDILLKGFYLEDREQRPLLQVETIGIDLDLPALWHHEVRIPEVRVEGVQALLVKPSRDSVSNFQFILDAFKKDSLQQEAPEPELPKRKMSFDINHFSFERVAVSFNERQLALAALRYAREPRDSASQPLHHLTIENLYFKNVHDRPRKNTGKPNRGFFDPAYLEVTASLKLDIDYLGKDTLHAMLRECTATDSITGIDIRRVTADIAATPERVLVQDLEVKQTETIVRIDSCTFQLPDKQAGRELSYHTSLVQGRAILRDISRAFAPPLREFRMPVLFRCRMHGNADEIAFNDIEVSTTNKHLLVLSKGTVRHMRDKYALHVHFDVPRMYAKNAEVIRVINQFPIKRFLMEQLQELGTITYRGGLDVFYKRVMLRGTVGTQAGPLDATLNIDSQKHYLTGQFATKDFHLGEVMDMKQLGNVSMTAGFKFDISKARTAVMRRRKGGKLPIGEITAHVTEASYFVAKTRNLYAHIVSDGALAEGKIMLPGSHMDIFCIFSFTNTQELKKMKFKPGLKFHSLTEKRKDRKERKKKERERKKEEKERRTD